jgi:hypothetical protein
MTTRTRNQPVDQRELVRIEIAPVFDGVPDKSGNSFWKKMLGVLAEALPSLSEDLADDLYSRLEKQAIENEQKKEEIDLLRERSATERTKREHEESLYGLERKAKEIAVKKAGIEAELLAKELAA